MSVHVSTAIKVGSFHYPKHLFHCYVENISSDVGGPWNLQAYTENNGLPERPQEHSHERKDVKHCSYLPAITQLVSHQGLEVFGWAANLTHQGNPCEPGCLPQLLASVSQHSLLAVPFGFSDSEDLRSFWDSLPTFPTSTCRPGHLSSLDWPASEAPMPYLRGTHPCKTHTHTDTHTSSSGWIILAVWC